MGFFRRVPRSILFVLAVGSFLILACVVDAGETVTHIKAHGKLHCGVSEGIEGLSTKDAQGRWSGMDVDFCRALAAGVLGDAAKVDFVPLTAAERFPALKNGQVDVLVRDTTWTLEREAVLGVIFAGVLYFEGQGFMVPATSGVKELSQLNGATICVVKGTTHEENLRAAFSERGMSFQPLVVDTLAQAAEALFTGKCRAITSEKPQLTTVRMRAPGGPKDHHILQEEISREPTGPVVLRGDEDWFTIVRWVLFTLIKAEELGCTGSNVRAMLENQNDARTKPWATLDGIVAKSLGIAPGWGIRVVESGGNYGEMYERNLGKQSVVQQDRGLNRLWKDGGLMISPPFR